MFLGSGCRGFRGSGVRGFRVLGLGLQGLGFYGELGGYAGSRFRGLGFVQGLSLGSVKLHKPKPLSPGPQPYFEGQGELVSGLVMGCRWNYFLAFTIYK